MNKTSTLSLAISLIALVLSIIAIHPTMPTPSPNQSQTPKPTPMPTHDIQLYAGGSGEPLGLTPKARHYEELSLPSLDGSGWIVPMKIEVYGNVTFTNCYVRSFPIPLHGSTEFPVSAYNGSITVWVGKERDRTTSNWEWFHSNVTDPLDSLTLVDFKKPPTFIDKYVIFYIVIPDGTKLLPSGEEVATTMVSYGIMGDGIYTGYQFS